MLAATAILMALPSHTGNDLPITALTGVELPYAAMPATRKTTAGTDFFCGGFIRQRPSRRRTGGRSPLACTPLGPAAHLEPCLPGTGDGYRRVMDSNWSLSARGRRAPVTRLLVCLVGALAVVSASSCGDDAADQDEIHADLTVTVSHPDHQTMEYRLVCRDGSADTVEGALVAVDPARACEALDGAAAASRLVDGPPPDRICTQVYGGPDVATITGNIGERSVSTVIDRTDGCGINDWDEVLGDVLPPPRDPEPS